MKSSCGATDCEAVESQVKSEKQNSEKQKADVEISQESYNYKSSGGSSNIETIEFAHISNQTLGISIKGGVDHPFLVSKDKVNMARETKDG